MKHSPWFEPQRFQSSDYIPSNSDLNVKRAVESGNPSLHWHDYCEIELVTKGRMIHSLNGVSSEICEGGLYFLTPADFHEIHVIETVELYNISFKDILIPTIYLNTFMGSHNGIVINLTGENFDYMSLLMQKLYDAYYSNYKYKDHYIKTLLNSIFSEIAYNCTDYCDSGLDTLSDPIRRVLMFLHCNFRENPSLSEAAMVAGLSENYFCEIFHKTTGQKYNRYLNDLKLKYAYNLIISSKASITDICFASGYDSLSHFQKEFKMKYLCSSRELRRRQNNKLV